MKCSVHWLREWVDITASTNELIEQLTQLGFEVGGIGTEHTLDITIPPDRGDCLSILGIARELSAFYQITLNDTKQKSVLPEIVDVPTISIDAKQACSRYLGRLIQGIDVNIKIPDWMTERLESCGCKSVSTVVDVTNYVMLELGQPIHAFDFNCVEKEIKVRYAKAGEKILLLDGTELELTTYDLVVADDARPMALAGIMGSQAFSVTPNTHTILLECACFEPIGVRFSVRAHCVHSNSSYRFERGVDPKLQKRAIERTTEILLDIVVLNTRIWLTR